MAITLESTGLRFPDNTLQTTAAGATTLYGIGTYLFGLSRGSNSTLGTTYASTRIGYGNNFGEAVAYPSISGTWRFLGGQAMTTPGPYMSPDAYYGLWVRVS